MRFEIKYPYKNSEAFLMFLGPCNVNVLFFLSITNKMQRYTIFFITVNAVHVSGGFSALHQKLKTVRTASGICQACLLLPLAVAASKLDIYPMLRVHFLSSLWWAEKPPKTCTALTVIKNIVASCWLYLKKILVYI